MQVSLAPITTDTDTFQFRDEVLQEAHAEELRSHLRPGEPLDAMTIWRNPETGTLIVIDGYCDLSMDRDQDGERSDVENVFKMSSEGLKRAPFEMGRHLC